LQDRVASSVAGAIEPKLRQSEIERASRKPTANLTAYDLYLRALAQSYRYTDEGVAEAVVLARQALAIDPSYAPAAAFVGWCRVVQQWQGWRALSASEVAEACRLARQALEAERDDADTICQAAWTLFYLAGEAAMAAALDRALALNPNAAHAWLIRGIIHALRNRPDAAIDAVERARRLSPFDPYTYFYAHSIAWLISRRDALNKRPNGPTTPFTTSRASSQRCGLKSSPMPISAISTKASAELGRMLAIHPELTIAGFCAYAHFLAPEVLELYVSGLSLAGLSEECAAALADPEDLLRVKSSCSLGLANDRSRRDLTVSREAKESNPPKPARELLQ
jgi:adenylate cyclase